jgi:hypothetical protein
MTGPAADVFTLTPNQLTPINAHNYLVEFLRENYRFKTVQDRYSFVKILASCNAENPGWVSNRSAESG